MVLAVAASLLGLAAIMIGVGGSSLLKFRCNTGWASGTLSAAFYTTDDCPLAASQLNSALDIAAVLDSRGFHCYGPNSSILVLLGPEAALQEEVMALNQFAGRAGFVLDYGSSLGRKGGTTLALRPNFSCRAASRKLANALAATANDSIGGKAHEGDDNLRVAAVQGPAPGDGPAVDDHVRDLGLIPRRQWDSSYGYSAETSVIIVGMYHSQYMSQWTARALASPKVVQTKPRSMMLLGGNDAAAIERMKLVPVAFNTAQQDSTDEFLCWVKHSVLQGWPVIIGVYRKGFRDLEYDHAVPVHAISSQSSLAADAAAGASLPYRRSDSLVLSDHFGNMYNITFRDFQRSRRDANRRTASKLSLRNTPRNYGIAISGVADTQGVTIPVRLTSDRNSEARSRRKQLTSPPKSFPITLTATVLVPAGSTTGYTLYTYTDVENVRMGCHTITGLVAFERGPCSASRLNWRLSSMTACHHCITLTFLGTHGKLQRQCCESGKIMEHPY